jgi:phospholipase C
MTLDRRTFVKGALGASGAVILGAAGAAGAAAGADGDGPAGATTLRAALAARATKAAAALPEPARSGIEHVIVVMMENRSFDHFLGWLPGAEGRQAGLSYADPQGTSQPTFHQKQFSGCGFTDPDHSYAGGRLQYNGGKMDGFLSDAANDSFAVGYYKPADRPFMSRLARAYTTCDRYFCSILGPTYPNRFFQHAGQTDRLDDALTKSTLPTIWDQLNQSGGPTGRYYYSDVPFVALWGGAYASISAPFSEFLSDVASGQLPNVSYLDPKFAGEATGTSADDHPLADIRAGDAFLSQVFHAVATGPGWDKTVLVINYDEWGGFFEHVPPHRITAGVAGRDGAGGRRRHGPRPPRQGALGVPRAVHHRVAVHPRRRPPYDGGLPQFLRPHVGAQAHRVALEPAPADPARCLARPARSRQPRHRPQLLPSGDEGPRPPGAGAVHPHRVRRDGERRREQLVDRAGRLAAHGQLGLTLDSWA